MTDDPTPAVEALTRPHDHTVSGCEYPCSIVAGTPEPLPGVLTDVQRRWAEWYRRGYVDGSAALTPAQPVTETTDLRAHVWTDAPDDEEAWYCQACHIVECGRCPHKSSCPGAATHDTEAAG